MKRDGYTLVEVMVAFVILMLAVETAAIGTAVAVKIGRRAEDVRAAGVAGAGDVGTGGAGAAGAFGAAGVVRATEETEIPAKFRLRLSDDGDFLTGDGYCYGSGSPGGMWVELLEEVLEEYDAENENE